MPTAVSIVGRLISFLIVLLLVEKSSSMSLPIKTTAKSSTTTTSLGGPALRTVVTQAAASNAEESLDLSGILWLEHINLVVGDKDQAAYFYTDVLGLTRDTGGSFHFNLGQQQFHLAQVENEPAQRISGSIGLTFPSLVTLRERVERSISDGRLQDTQFRILADEPDCLTLSCPWGNRLHCYSVDNDDTKSQQMASSPQKMVNLHSNNGGAYGAQRMAVRGQPGIRYVEIACPDHSVKAIIQFYKQMLGCSVDCTTAADGHDVGLVCVGPGVHLVFSDTKHLTEDDVNAKKGVHLCIYHAHFEQLYQKLQQHKLIWTNPRFTHLDTCTNWEEAKMSRTLRFKHIVDLDDNDKRILELEHETRPLRHGQYMKVPNYNAV